MVNIVKLKELTQNLDILYVEDEVELAQTVIVYLQKIFRKVDIAVNGAIGLELATNNNYDIIVSDIMMPVMNGLEMAKNIRKIRPNQNILIVSAYSDVEYFIESIALSIDGYILKPFDYEQFNQMVYKIAYKIKNFKENKIYHERLEQLVEEKTKEAIALQNEKIENFEKTLFALVDMVEARDTYTGGHSKRVANYSLMLAKELGLSQIECNNIYKAGILHDIGKIAIPDTILLKPNMLNPLEFKIIKEHVIIGYKMLQELPMFANLAPIIKGHHERLDGSGYPDGLQGDEILLGSNIMAVADAFDAMTTSRIYKKAKSVQEAIIELGKYKDIHFRSEIVEAAMKVFKDFEVDNSINQLPYTELEQERFAYFYKDQLTQCYNHNYLELVLIKNKFSKEYSTMDIFLVHNFGEYNNKRGWDAGDRFLIQFSNFLKNRFPNSILFRVYGDDFVLISKEPIPLNYEELLQFFDDTPLSLVYQSEDIFKEEIFTLKDFEKKISKRKD